MNRNFKPVMDALLAHLQAAVEFSFTATSVANNPTITSVSSFTGLFAGLPVFGPGMAKGVVINSLDSVAGTITLSQAMTASGTAQSFTTGFLTTGRRVQHWNQVSDQPALFLRRTGVLDQYNGPLSVTILECEAWIYCNSGQNPEISPDDQLSCLEQLVRTSLWLDGGRRETLGGLVEWCRIEGKSDVSPGDQGPQAIARIPIRVRLP